MKRSILLVCSVFASIFGAFAQDSTFYYVGDEKIFLKEDPTCISVITPKTIKNNHVITPPLNVVAKDTINHGDSFTIILYQQISPKRGFAKETLEKAFKTRIDTTISIITPTFFYGAHKIILTNTLSVRLKKNGDFPLLERFIKKYHLKVLGQGKRNPLIYFLSITPTTSYNSLEIANKLHESGLFYYAEPNFENNIWLCGSNDPYIGNQWGLFNLQNKGIDTKACAAWPYATGKGIKIAIIDTGIDKTHIDLNENIDSLSYDAESNTPSSNYYNPHGTRCAGIIAAIQNNGKMITGIAPDATLMDISFYPANNYRTSFESIIANAIEWACDNGADIISCSWETTVSSAVREAINYALVYGRNGKGTIIVTVTGNDGTNNIPFPGNFRPEIITVGAITRQGERWENSSYGNAIDVVAPGDSILTLNPGSTTLFRASGTSFAAPHVAGLAALILERNPNLTGQQVRNIIEQNTIKVDALNHPYSTVSGRPNGTWNQYCGYGLINAYEAVKNTPRW